MRKKESYPGNDFQDPCVEDRRPDWEKNGFENEQQWTEYLKQTDKWKATHPSPSAGENWMSWLDYYDELSEARKEIKQQILNPDQEVSTS